MRPSAETELIWPSRVLLAQRPSTPSGAPSRSVPVFVIGTSVAGGPAAGGSGTQSERVGGRSSRGAFAANAQRPCRVATTSPPSGVVTRATAGPGSGARTARSTPSGATRRSRPFAASQAPPSGVGANGPGAPSVALRATAVSPQTGSRPPASGVMTVRPGAAVTRSSLVAVRRSAPSGTGSRSAAASGAAPTGASTVTTGSTVTSSVTAPE